MIPDLFTETNPDKGTKTAGKANDKIEGWLKFTETNPDKGTETFMQYIQNDRMKMFTETNPDKGTKT